MFPISTNSHIPTYLKYISFFSSYERIKTKKNSHRNTKVPARWKLWRLGHRWANNCRHVEFDIHSVNEHFLLRIHNNYYHTNRELRWLCNKFSSSYESFKNACAEVKVTLILTLTLRALFHFTHEKSIESLWTRSE